jgi:hypothetical protein
MKLPIVNACGEIVGYTNESPKLVGTSVRHSYAERLLGDAVKAAYVEITDQAELARVGAPPDWSGEWRCLALCSADMPVENDIAMVRTTKLHARYSAGRAAVIAK